MKKLPLHSETADAGAHHDDKSALQRFFRLRDVLALTGLTTSTLYEMMRDGTFPRPMNISKRLVVWPERDIADWQATQIAKHGKESR